MALIEKLPLEIDALSLLAEGLNFDFASKGIDEPLTGEELQSMPGDDRHPRRSTPDQRQDNPSTRDFITFSGRGQTQDAIVGGPKEIGATNSKRCSFGPRLRRFVIAATYVPGGPTSISCAISSRNCSAAVCFTRIRRQDLARKSGLPRPAAGAWKSQPRAAAE